MPHADSLILTLVGGFVLAFVFGMLAHRLKLSPLVGYLVAGVIVGPYTGGFVADTELAPQLAEIGGSGILSHLVFSCVPIEGGVCQLAVNSGKNLVG